MADPMPGDSSQSSRPENAARRSLSISVRELIEFVLRTGDLGGDRHFVSASRALEGTRGHQRIQRSRPAGYEPEVFLSHTIETDAFTLTIKGRLDGVLKTQETIIVEEIKTVSAGWNNQPDPLHWAQAKVYAFLLLQRHPSDAIVIQLTYLDLETGLTTEFRETMSSLCVADFFESVTRPYIEWISEQVIWWAQRDRSIAELRFPFDEYRAGQRKLAVAAYRILTDGGTLFAEAPTGIGKTISVLFPAIKALGEGSLSKIFYLTAKTMTRTVAEGALADLRNRGLRFRSVTLTAKEKICQQNGQPCDPSSCPLARGYYDRYKAALREGLACETLTRENLDETGRRHLVCPFELSLDLAVWVDAVICDYNYVFDPKVYLRRFFSETSGDYGFLVDEAHNLVERARDMFSADLSKPEILAVRQSIAAALPHCAKALQKIANAWPGEEMLELLSNTELTPTGGRAQKELPETLIPLLRLFLQCAETWLAQNQPADYREALLALYFRISGFVRTAALYDEHYVTLVDSERLRLFCVDPSKLIQAAVQRGKSAVFFSATLRPARYFQSVLGRDENDSLIQLPSPFPQENFQVLIADTVGTALRQRRTSYDQVCHSIAAFISGRPGNYLVYFPSYNYLAEVLERFRAFRPDITIVAQSGGMAESEREQFLRAFQSGQHGTLVGFAVLGGIFGEGIDLVGDRLIGAVVVGVGLPQISIERDLIRAYYDEKGQSGFDYAYTFPGINRVLQAVGRVIRSKNDLGIALLIDVRFGHERYRDLLPNWWMPLRVANPKQIEIEAKRFWQGQSECALG